MTRPSPLGWTSRNSSFFVRPVSPMRELEREPTSDIPPCTRLAIVGQGRLGTALARALADSGLDVIGPLGRGTDGADAEAVLLCVPDAEIARAAALITPGRLVGHCSGASTLGVLAPHEAFSLHPLMTVTRAGASFDGAGAAIAGTTPGSDAVRDRAGHATGHATRSRGRARPRPLPRRGLGGVEFPHHRRGGGRAADANRGRRAGAARAAGARHGRELGRQPAPSRR